MKHADVAGQILLVMTSDDDHRSRPTEAAGRAAFFPARAAQLEINGKVAPDNVWAAMRGDRQGSSATLAWSETWVKPKS